MINLLPPKDKEQIKYGKLNVVLRHYIIIAVVIIGSLLVLSLASYVYADIQMTRLQSSLKERQQQRAQFNSVEQKVQTLQSNLRLIEKLFNNKTEYSAVLQDIAASLPVGAYINKVSLTGKDNEPVQLMISVNSLDTAGTLHNALLKSSRIKSADIQSVNKNSNNDGYTVDVVIAFKDGGSR